MRINSQNEQRRIHNKTVILSAIAVSLMALCLWIIYSRPSLAQAPILAAKPTNKGSVSSQSPRPAFALYGSSLTAVRKSLLFYAIGPLSERDLRSIDGSPHQFSVTLPLIVDEKQNRLYVTPLINGQKVRLIVDTGGGPGILLNKAVAKKITLDHPLPVLLHGVQGHESATEGVAHSIRFGSLALRAIDTVVAHDNHPGEICSIGMPLFQHYRVMLDFTAKTMTLSRGGSPAASVKGEASLSLPFRDDYGSILVSVRVLNQSTWACLDSGVTLNILSLKMAKAAATQLSLGESASYMYNRQIGLGDTYKNTTLLFLARMVPISVGSDRTATAFDTTSQVGGALFEDGSNDAFSVPTDAYLGAQFLLQFHRVIIDYPNHMLILQGIRHGASANRTSSSSASGKPWPGYVWQRSGDGWIEVPDKSAASVPLPNVTPKQTVTTIVQPEQGNVLVIINGVESKYPLGTTVTTDTEGKVNILPPSDAATKRMP